jgi:hypothetical protein
MLKKTLKKISIGVLLVAGSLATISSSTTQSALPSGVRMAGVPKTNPDVDLDGVLVKATLACVDGDCYRYNLTIKNTTNDTVEVVWDKVQYVENGQTKSGVMFEGIRYMEKEAPKAPSIVIPGGTLTRELQPTNNVTYAAGRYGGWRTTPMPRGGDVGLVVTIRRNQEERNVIFAHSIRMLGPHESDAWVEPQPPATPQAEAVAPSTENPEPAKMD